MQTACRTESSALSSISPLGSMLRCGIDAAGVFGHGEPP